MKNESINDIIEKIKNRIDAHRISSGVYSRYLWQNSGGTRIMGSNPYGCADAANLLYTIGAFPSKSEEREVFVRTLQDFQNRETGLFFESTHHIVHTTAHCIGALELFDATPSYPLYDLKKYRDIEVFFREMQEADFLHLGKMAHFGAGLFASFVNTKTVGEEWINRYFDWFDEQCDSESGMWVREPADAFPIHLRMGDAFHYLFNYEYMHRAFPYPERLIDSCLAMYRDGKMPKTFGRQFHFIEMDWVYCLNRASRQTVYRFDEIRETLAEFAKDFISYLRKVDFETNDEANDLHLLFGVCCCLAELQNALPGAIYTEKPLRLTLDRRPFI